jgi:hypothetical protein
MAKAWPRNHFADAGLPHRGQIALRLARLLITTEGLNDEGESLRARYCSLHNILGNGASGVRSRINLWKPGWLRWSKNRQRRANESSRSDGSTSLTAVWKSRAGDQPTEWPKRNRSDFGSWAFCSRQNHRSDPGGCASIGIFRSCACFGDARDGLIL